MPLRPGRVERPTSTLSESRSNRMSYGRIREKGSAFLLCLTSWSTLDIICPRYKGVRPVPQSRNRLGNYPILSILYGLRASLNVRGVTNRDFTHFLLSTETAGPRTQFNQLQTRTASSLRRVREPTLGLFTEAAGIGPATGVLETLVMPLHQASKILLFCLLLFLNFLL